MTQATPALCELAQRILAQETGPADSPEDVAPIALKVFERLRLHLTIFVGEAGYQAMLSRALTLAKREDPWLRERSVLLTNATLDLGTNQDTSEAAAGIIALLAQLLGLVTELVGEALMLRLVQDVWPTVSLDLSLNNQAVNGEVTR